MNKKLEIKTVKNLESAFAGESMAYQKYLYFAKLARKKGNEAVAKVFEDTAKHEIGHAEGHLRFLYPEEQLTVEDLLKLAIEGETYEYTEMYPGFEKTARAEGQELAVMEFKEQILESKEHALFFQKNLEKISKIFSGLAKAEKIHAEGYQNALKAI
ncbi:MAG: rubrerythrin family protein [Bacteriovoracaceae bacterium]